MRLLNLGCGADRFGDPWTNLDDLHSQLPEGTPERAQLDAEPNYVNHDIASGPLPFNAQTFDGILASHVVEHFDCQAAARLMQNCLHILKPGGVLLVSVPDASYFRNVYHHDTKAACMELFGEGLNEDDPSRTFFDAALWFNQHYGILTEDALWCYFVRAGFKPLNIYRVSSTMPPTTEPMDGLGIMQAALNRPKFSLAMAGVRT